MSIDVEAILKVITHGVPALLVIGGIILLLIGYPKFWILNIGDG